MASEVRACIELRQRIEPGRPAPEFTLAQQDGSLLSFVRFPWAKWWCLISGQAGVSRAVLLSQVGSFTRNTRTKVLRLSV